MIGVVNANLEATLRIVVIGSSGKQQPIEAIVDTGFSGFLTLQPAVIASLGLVLLGNVPGTLADGSTVLFDVFQAEVLWNGVPRSVEINAVDSDSLLGAQMLRDHEVNIHMVVGGVVTIAPLP